MATGTIPVSIRASIEHVLQAYAASNPQTQQDIRHMVGTGFGGVFFSLSSSRGNNRTLYKRDFYEWAQSTAALLRGRQGGDIDLETLAEEVEGLGISQKHVLGSQLSRLVMHLLTWYYQPGGRQPGYSWRSTIIHARDEIAMILDDSPSLRRQVPDLLARRYPAARKLAQNETGLPLATFPPTCPWTPEQVLDADFWPEEEPAP